jgi:FlaA1/EpsC-like NDP-sugar epimerase
LLGDCSKPTSHPRIMTAHEEFLPWAQLTSHLDELKAAMDAGEVNRIRQSLAQLVSGYEVKGCVVDWVLMENTRQDAVINQR